MSTKDTNPKDLARDIAKHLSKQLADRPASALSVLPEYLTAAQVALMTGFTPKALEGMRARREGPPFIRIGTSIRYRATDVRRWIESCAEARP